MGSSDRFVLHQKSPRRLVLAVRKYVGFVDGHSMCSLYKVLTTSQTLSFCKTDVKGS
jgi:hypothetical protein